MPMPMRDDVGMNMQGDLVLWWFNCKFDRKSAYLTAHWINLMPMPDQLMPTGAKVAENLHRFDQIAALLHICTFDGLGPD